MDTKLSAYKLARKSTYELLQDKPLILGIDPGLDGAVAILRPLIHHVEAIVDIPTFKVPSASRKTGFIRHVDSHALSMALDNYAFMTAFAVIEDVHSMPRDGHRAAFTFGKVTGILHGVLAGHYVPTFPVSPTVWKPSLGVPSDKREATMEARRRFPKYESLFRKKSHHNRAEALMLAYYGFRHIAA